MPLLPAVVFFPPHGIGGKSGPRPESCRLVDHYLTAGPRASAFPCPLFDRNWYVSKYPDIAKIDLDPLAHYMTNGWREGRWPHPLFDPKSYLDINADLDKLTNPLQHFIQRGAREGRVAFSPDLFASQDASGRRSLPISLPRAN